MLYEFEPLQSLAHVFMPGVILALIFSVGMLLFFAVAGLTFFSKRFRPSNRTAKRKVSSPVYLTAFASGVFAALAMTTATAILVSFKISGVSAFSFESLIGQNILGHSDGSYFYASFIIHLLLGGAFALFYQRVFSLLGSSGGRLGILLGTVHGVLASLGWGLFFIFRDAFSFGNQFSPGNILTLPSVLIFFAMHLLYGLTVGALSPAQLTEGSVIELNRALPARRESEISPRKSA